MKKLRPAEVDKAIARYRASLKSWTSVAAGIEAGDEAALSAEMERLRPLLARIVAEYPALAYKVDVLVKARRRSHASSDDDRPQRPPGYGSGS